MTPWGEGRLAVAPWGFSLGEKISFEGAYKLQLFLGLGQGGNDPCL